MNRLKLLYIKMKSDEGNLRTSKMESDNLQWNITVTDLEMSSLRSPKYALTSATDCEFDNLVSSQELVSAASIYDDFQVIAMAVSWHFFELHL